MATDWGERQEGAPGWGKMTNALGLTQPAGGMGEGKTWWPQDQSAHCWQRLCPRDMQDVFTQASDPLLSDEKTDRPERTGICPGPHSWVGEDRAEPSKQVF